LIDLYLNFLLILKNNYNPKRKKKKLKVLLSDQ
jgi:hypothetical protein